MHLSKHLQTLCVYEQNIGMLSLCYSAVSSCIDQSMAFWCLLTNMHLRSHRLCFYVPDTTVLIYRVVPHQISLEPLIQSIETNTLYSLHWCLLTLKNLMLILHMNETDPSIIMGFERTCNVDNPLF